MKKFICLATILWGLFVFISCEQTDKFPKKINNRPEYTGKTYLINIKGKLESPSENNLTRALSSAVKIGTIGQNDHMPKVDYSNLLGKPILVKLCLRKQGDIRGNSVSFKDIQAKVTLKDNGSYSLKFLADNIPFQIKEGYDLDDGDWFVSAIICTNRDNQANVAEGSSINLSSSKSITYRVKNSDKSWESAASDQILDCPFLISSFQPIHRNAITNSIDLDLIFKPLGQILIFKFENGYHEDLYMQQITFESQNTIIGDDASMIFGEVSDPNSLNGALPTFSTQNTNTVTHKLSLGNVLCKSTTKPNPNSVYYFVYAYSDNINPSVKVRVFATKEDMSTPKMRELLSQEGTIVGNLNQQRSVLKFPVYQELPILSTNSSFDTGSQVLTLQDNSNSRVNVLPLKIPSSDLMITEYYYYHIGGYNYSMIEIYNASNEGKNLYDYGLVRCGVDEAGKHYLYKPKNGTNYYSENTKVQDIAAIWNASVRNVLNTTINIPNKKSQQGVKYIYNTSKYFQPSIASKQMILPPGKTIVVCAGGTQFDAAKGDKPDNHKYAPDGGEFGFGNYIGQAVDARECIYVAAVDNGSSKLGVPYNTNSGVFQVDKDQAMILVKKVNNKFEIIDATNDMTSPAEFKNFKDALLNIVDIRKAVNITGSNTTGDVKPFSMIRKDGSFFPSKRLHYKMKDGQFIQTVESDWAFITRKYYTSSNNSDPRISYRNKISSWGTRSFDQNIFDRANSLDWKNGNSYTAK